MIEDCFVCDEMKTSEMFTDEEILLYHRGELTYENFDKQQQMELDFIFLAEQE